MKQLEATPYTFTEAGGLPPLPDVQLTLSSDPTDKSGEIEVMQQSTYAKLPWLQQNIIGILSDNTGTTEFTASFSLNEKYGQAVFRGIACDAVDSAAITVYGETRNSVDAKIAAYIANSEIEFIQNQNNAAALFTVSTGVLAVLAGVVFVANPFSLAVIALGFVLLAAKSDFQAGKEGVEFQKWKIAYEEWLEPV
ncbi:MAG: hypothetical protein KDD60_12605, partial [Bdellovibrionales bacterium]|nr:hypothetical protein [Bdellovibrionales bacterium]